MEVKCRVGQAGAQGLPRTLRARDCAELPRPCSSPVKQEVCPDNIGSHFLICAKTKCSGSTKQHFDFGREAGALGASAEPHGPREGPGAAGMFMEQLRALPRGGKGREELPAGTCGRVPLAGPSGASLCPSG